MQVQQVEQSQAAPASFPRTVPVSVGITLAALVLAGGLVSLAGWLFSIPRLIDWEGNGITIKANAAICLVLSASALLIGLAFPRQKNPVRILGGAVAAVGLLTLLEHAFGVNFGIDNLLFLEPPGALATDAPGRMGIPGSMSFLMFGTALVLKKGTPAQRRIASGLGLAVVAVALLSITGYIFRADPLYSIPKTTGIAMQTAVMLALLGLGLVAAIPESGLAAAMYRLDAGGVVLRRLLLPTLIIPFLLGWVSVHGQNSEWYDGAFGSSVHSVIEIVLLVGLVWWTSAGISRVTETVEARERLLRTVTDYARIGLVIVDSGRRYRYANRAYADVLGLPGHEIIGKHVQDVLPAQYESHIKPRLDLAFSGQEVEYELEVPSIEKPGRARCVRVRYQPQGSGGTVDAVIVTVIDVTESKRLHETLEQKVRERTDELSAANEQLQGFTYSVAHDLRQQIRGINVNASMLMLDAGEELSGESRDLLQRMSNSALKLGALVDDLLTYARLGQQEPKLERVDLSSMFEEAANAIIDDGYCGKDSFEIQKGMVARGDPAMLRIVVQNLLDNAVKYSRNAQPSPRIEVGEQDGAFFVRDNGIGFDMRFVDKLFKPFERLHHEDEFAGTGIGLANVRRIVRKHGGSVWAEGKPGKGATFFFALTGKS